VNSTNCEVLNYVIFSTFVLLFLLGANILLSNSFSKFLSLRFSLTVTDQKGKVKAVPVLNAMKTYLGGGIAPRILTSVLEGG